MPQGVGFEKYRFEAESGRARASFAGGEIERSAELFRKAADVCREDFQSPMLQEQSLRMIGPAAGGGGRVQGGHRSRRTHAGAQSSRSPRAVARIRRLFQDGQVDRALEWSQRAIELYPDEMGTLLNAACLYLKLREKEKAMTLLEQVFARGWCKRDWIEQDPDYDILRDDPRFQQLLAQLK